MELYVLNDMYQNEYVIDSYISLIWTERFNAHGDASLIVKSTPATRKMFVEDVMLGLSKSRRIMVIDTITDKVDEEGRKVLEIKCVSLEKILMERIAIRALGDTTSVPFWPLEGTIPNIMRKIFEDICVKGEIQATDKIPHLASGNPYPRDTVKEPEDYMVVELKPTTVYQALNDLGTQYDQGFRLVRNSNDGKLYWSIYPGGDRTSGQTTNDVILFSDGLDNLANTTEFRSIANFKNVAYVISPLSSMFVYAEGYSAATSGIQRRVLLVEVTDLGDLTVGTQLNNYLYYKGREALAQHNRVVAFDGEVSQNGSIVYDKDYFLGDLVEFRNKDGVQKRVRAVEQTFSSDSTGNRSYPTMQDVLYIYPGSWIAQPPELTWDKAEGTWDER